MATAAGLKEIATYADVVGAHKDLVIPVKDGALGTPTALVKDAMEHAVTMAVPLDVSTGIGSDWQLAAH